MLATTTESIILAAGGVLTALIGGGFTFAGVVYNVGQQRRARRRALDHQEMAQLRDAIAELRLEVELERQRRQTYELVAAHWRDAAIAALGRPDMRD